MNYIPLRTEYFNNFRFIFRKTDRAVYGILALKSGPLRNGLGAIQDKTKAKVLARLKNTVRDINVRK